MPYCKIKNFDKLKICTGDLRHKIKLQTKTLSGTHFDSIDFIDEFTDVADVWAAIENVSGEEIFSKINTDEAITHRFYIRYRNDITQENWILYKDERYKIVNITNIAERNKYLVLEANIKGDDVLKASSW